ncbi:uncharacterized protein EV422DRAFT_567993 [Fimicolochytrium jonesii]|uniref:uncharacterized protein n=1 Tax=Fimicolochytrium jonesii TaxID=1396493 RepID=UPI0022FE041D|nr:uncharacterized protein EV422DRAFT_567993 [Fimicolochytrium jonesii]KAI8820569.1 hypothetical protein EV422DRAFT_567993 [Fimicolochytrium jonesii]
MSAAERFLYESAINDLAKTVYGDGDLQHGMVQAPTDTTNAATTADGTPNGASEGSLPTPSTAQHQPPHRRRKPPSRLLIFDFDSTLFRSPMPNPDLWSDQLRGALIGDCGWFQDPRTMQPPYVPDIPDASWYHSETVAAVFAGIARRDEDTLCVLLTGRRHDRFGERIKRICQVHHPPLEFDLFFFREGHDPAKAPLYHATTLDFKLAVLDSLFTAFPSITHVEIYDDRKRHLDLFANRLRSLSTKGKLRSFAVHHVVHTNKSAKYMPEDSEKELVKELVAICNGRILAAKRREEDAHKQQRGGRGGEGDCDGSMSRTSSCASQASLTDCSDDNVANREDKQPLTTRASTSSPTPFCKLQRRTSASLFRTMLELVDQIKYTAILLDPSSVTKLTTAFPPPHSDAVTKYHHVTINLGPAKPHLVDPLGGLGAPVTVRVIAHGTLPDKVTAVKVEHAHDPTLKLSENDTPHITLHVRTGGKAADSNLIAHWDPLSEPFTLTGHITQIHITGLNTDTPTPQKKKEVSIGDLVKKHHPGLQGRQIGQAVAHVSEWMEKGFMENLSSNRAYIEWYIQGMDVGKVGTTTRRREAEREVGREGGGMAAAMGDKVESPVSS